MASQLDSYFNKNDTEAERLGVRYDAVHEKRMSIAYVTRYGVSIAGDRIGESGLPYEAVHDGVGDVAISTGRTSIGTFKSMVIGGLSGVVARKERLIPVHAAIASSPELQSIAFSGRGNSGKTTSMLGSYGHLMDRDFKVVTDDWAFIDEENLSIHPVDLLAAVRPESIEGLESIHGRKWVRQLLGRAVDFCEGDSKSEPVALSDIYGEDFTTVEGTLAAALFTSVNPLYERVAGIDRPVLTKRSSAPRALGEQLRGAYHSPSLVPKEGEPKLERRYDDVTGQLECSQIYTRTSNANRTEQAQQVSNWIDEVVR